MSVLKYIFAHMRTLVYFIFSCILTVIFTLLAGDPFRFELFPIFFLLILLIRIADDIHDYTIDSKNGKQQDLSKRALLILFIILASLFVLIHIISFGVIGLLSILFIAYIQLEVLLEILKRFFLFLLSLAYLFLLNGYINFCSIPIIIYLVISLILPTLFELYKRRKRK